MRTDRMVKGITRVGLLVCVVAAQAHAIEFRLHDVRGREVRAEDYKGRPLFLEFGACW